MALALSVVFGAGWVLGKTATSHFSPILVAAWRFGVAGLVLSTLCGWPSVPPRRLLLASALAISIPYSLSYVGLSRLDVSVAVLLTQLEAPMLIALSAVLLKEAPSWTTAAGVALSVAGVLFIVGSPSVDGQYAAVGVVMTSMGVWSAGQIQVRRLGLEDGGLKLLGAFSVLATPQLLIFSLLFEDGQLASIVQASATAWLQVAYLGFVMTVMGIGVWYHLLARYPLHLVAPFLLLVPVFSVAGGVIFLGERLPAATLVGGALIMAGVGIATVRRGERRPSPPMASVRNGP